MISCDPQNLASLARCFTCLPGATLTEIKTYLLCQLNNVGGFGQNLIPTGSLYSGSIPTFTLTVLANTAYTIVWGANDLSMTMGGVTYTSPGVGGMTTVYTKGNTSMVFTGTFAGTSVTAIVHVAIAAIPIPSGFGWTINGAGTQVTFSWDAPPSNVASTELWTSSDNITFTLAATVAAPGTSTVVAAPAIGSTLYAKARWIGLSTGGFTNVVPVNGTVADWAKRVVANGGADPSVSTKTALNTFVASLVSAGVDSLMISVCCFVPDNLIAAITPLYKVAGNDPWTNTGPFLAADLTVNGLINNGTTKMLNTGVVPSTALASANDGGLSLYQVTSNNTGPIDMGATNTTGGTVLMLALSRNSIGDIHWYCAASSGAGDITGTKSLFAGFVSGNRIAANNTKLYIASATQAFSTLATGAANLGSQPAFAVICFGWNQNGVLTSGPARRFSFAAVHHGLTSTQAQALFNAVQVLRVALGGGFV